MYIRLHILVHWAGADVEHTLPKNTYASCVLCSSNKICPRSRVYSISWLIMNEHHLIIYLKKLIKTSRVHVFCATAAAYTYTRQDNKRGTQTVVLDVTFVRIYIHMMRQFTWNFRCLCCLFITEQRSHSVNSKTYRNGNTLKEGPIIS